MLIVAPHAGAWIETYEQIVNALHAKGVAPHAGAWIETCLLHQESAPAPVAPHAGAWIETC